MYLGRFCQDTRGKYHREINNIDAISNTMMTMLLASSLSLRNNRATKIDIKADNQGMYALKDWHVKHL